MTLLKHLARKKCKDYDYLADAILKEDLDTHKKNKSFKPCVYQRNEVFYRPKTLCDIATRVRQ